MWHAEGVHGIVENRADGGGGAVLKRGADHIDAKGQIDRAAEERYVEQATVSGLTPLEGCRVSVDPSGPFGQLTHAAKKRPDGGRECHTKVPDLGRLHAGASGIVHVRAIWTITRKNHHVGAH